MSTIKLNEKQFNRIAKRFLANGSIRKEMSTPYLLKDNRIMATDAHTAVLINAGNLDYAYTPINEDETTKGKMERLVEYLFNGFNASTSLTLSKSTIQDTIKALKAIKKEHKPLLIEISFNKDRVLDFTCHYNNDDMELVEVVHTIEYKDIQIPPHRNSEFTVTVNVDILINALMTLKETDSKSTLNFTDDPMKPMLLKNETLQIIVSPINPTYIK